MVGIVSGIGLGFSTGSGVSLGMIGAPSTGSLGDGAYVDIATGNLVLPDAAARLPGSISRRDVPWNSPQASERVGSSCACVRP